MTFNAVRYRAYFEDARKRAEQVADPVEKQAWQRMAEKWLKFLALADQNAGRVVGDAMKEGARCGGPLTKRQVTDRIFRQTLVPKSRKS